MQVWQNWPRQPITNKNLAQQKPTYSITLLRVIPTMASNPNIQVKLWCNVLAWSSKSLAFFLTLVGKQFYRVTLRKLPGVTHDMSVYFSASSFYSLYDILSGIQSGILSLTFDLAFHLTFSLAFFLASWSHILIWHSFCVFSRRKKSGEAHSDF